MGFELEEQGGFQEERPSNIKNSIAQSLPMVSQAPKVADFLTNPKNRIDLATAVGGMMGGSILGIRGGMAAGTASRGLATGAEETGANISSATGLGDFIRQAELKDYQDLAKTVGIETGKQAALESVMGGIGKGISMAGKGLLNTVVGSATAKRAMTNAKGMLTQAYNSDVFPQQLATKVVGFWDEAKDVAYKGIKKAMNTPENIKKKVSIDSGKVIRKALGRHIDDVEKVGEHFTLKTGEEKLIKDTIYAIQKANGRKMNVKTLWGHRKNLDKAMKITSLSDDGRRIMTGLRNELNTPIRQAGRDIAESFDVYSSVLDNQKTWARYFSEVKTPGGQHLPKNVEVLSQKLSDAMGNKMIRQSLVDIDNMLPMDKRIMEELMDYGFAQKILDVPARGMKMSKSGLLEGIVKGVAGGQRGAVSKAAALTSPVGKGVRETIKRGAVQGGTSLLDEL